MQNKLRQEAASTRAIAAMLSLRADRDRLLARARELEARADALEGGDSLEGADARVRLGILPQTRAGQS